VLIEIARHRVPVAIHRHAGLRRERSDGCRRRDDDPEEQTAHALNTPNAGPKGYRTLEQIAAGWNHSVAQTCPSNGQQGVFDCIPSARFHCPERARNAALI
jgi:hypothetical protein